MVSGNLVFAMKILTIYRVESGEGGRGLTKEEQNCIAQYLNEPYRK